MLAMMVQDSEHEGETPVCRWSPFPTPHPSDTDPGARSTSSLPRDSDGAQGPRMSPVTEDALGDTKSPPSSYNTCLGSFLQAPINQSRQGPTSERANPTHVAALMSRHL